MAEIEAGNLPTLIYDGAPLPRRKEWSASAEFNRSPHRSTPAVFKEGIAETRRPVNSGAQSTPSPC